MHAGFCLDRFPSHDVAYIAVNVEVIGVHREPEVLLTWDSTFALP